ncbi:MAG TPA: hypothetical protein VGB20_07655 [bacterium]
MSRFELQTLVAVLALGMLSAVPASAQEDTRVLPTLLIKGQVVSLDAANPSAVLLRVKDRYGFETPIIINADTRVEQGGAAVGREALADGVQVEVEYNFDVNTAERHAVAVKLAVVESAAAAGAPAEPSAPEAPAMTEPAAEPAPEAMTPPAPAEPAEQ